MLTMHTNHLIFLIHAAFEEQPVIVATYSVYSESDLGALEDLYIRTQNLSAEGWLENARNNPAFKVFGNSEGCRSTSVGDYATVNGKLYRCASFGWEPANTIVCRNGY